jgi:pimeloyl-ACP methyl ester carboxylesterase
MFLPLKLTPSSRLMLTLRRFSFSPKKQKANEDVRLSKLELPSDTSKPMIVMHGFLGSKINFRTFCANPMISNRRKVFIIELRNHASSDHHDEHNYEVMSDDVIRFADEHELEKFTVMGHSMGGRTAMTLACRYPNRIDGVISLDAAPVNETGNHAFGSFTYHILDFMHNMKSVDDNITVGKAVEITRNTFKEKPQFSALIERSIKTDPQLLWND